MSGTTAKDSSRPRERTAVTQLPEVEVLRRDLEKEIVGKRFKEVTVKTAAIVGRHRNRPEFARALDGRKITAVSRRGIHLLIEHDDDTVLVIRVGPRATVVRRTATAEADRSTQVVATFTTGGAIHYQDPDKDGELFVATREEIQSLPELSPSGIDPLADVFTWHALSETLRKEQRRLDQLMTDSEFVVGLGDVYTDEVLWNAGLAGSRAASSLSSQEVRRLYRAILEVLHEAVKQGSGEESGGTGPQRQVYGREGEPCPRCRQPIRKTKPDGGREAYFCPQCQT